MDLTGKPSSNPVSVGKKLHIVSFIGGSDRIVKTIASSHGNGAGPSNTGGEKTLVNVWPLIKRPLVPDWKT